MTTFLVGTDFSSLSQKALTRAADLASCSQARIYLLHVLEPVDDPGSTDPDTEKFYSELKVSSNQKLEAQAEPLRAKGINVSTEIRIGARGPTILTVADELDAGLVVLGSLPISEGTPRIGTSHRVAMTSTRAVLLIP